MKLFGKELAKAETQIQSLQRQASELAAELKAATKDKASVAKALADASAQWDAKAKELEAKSKELNAAQAAATKAKQDGDSAAASIKAQLDAANKALAESKAQLEAKTKELEAKSKELNAAQAATTKAKQDGDSAAATIKTQLETANKALAESKAQLDTKTKELEAKAKELTSAQSANSKAKQDGDGAVAAMKAQLDAANKALAESKAQLEAKAKELEAKSKEVAPLKAERDKQAKLAQQTEAKYQDSAQENELLLLQLMQAQEELVEYYEQKGEFEKLYQAYKARWERLEKRLPNYLDFGAIEIVDVDGVSDVPSITWHVKDFAQAGVALTDFSFATVLQDGYPGIGLLQDGKPRAFVPKLLGANKEHLGIFLGLGTAEFKQLTAAVSILDQLESGQWQGFNFPAQFDPSFWRPSIKTLIAQLKQLPALLRYDEVRLKRELINPDYEHLWLEFHGLSMGAAHWKKFEIRLGAALVQTEGFSQYPKFEIPLIDGKTKPFDSWYTESQDDSGAKLELRFSLEKNVFDVAVWAKLSDADKALVLRLIYAMPDALKRLEQQNASIHRPWAVWVDFASAAIKVLEVNKAAAKFESKALPAPALPPTPVSTPSEQAKLPAPSKQADTVAKAGKVISIGNKPAAKKTTKTVRKTKA